jgi:DHA1 family multidrug resistance protein-like MFS transporter
VALWGIIAAVFLVGTGVGSILPILPLFIRERGASYSLIGVIVGANLAAQFLAQYPAGRLSDRFGRRPLMVGGLVIVAASLALFVLPLSVPWMIALRVVQGLGAAAFRPGSRAAIADLVPPGERGVAYGWYSGADMAGLIVGPALGGVLAAFGRPAVFEATAVVMLAAAVVVAITLADVRHRADAGEARPVKRETSVRSDPARAAIVGIAFLGAGIGFLYGVYDVVWPLFMKAIKATDWQIGASFSLFGLPLVMVAPLAGWASDRWDRRWLAAGSTASSALIAQVYPYLTSIPLVIGVGVVEAVTAAFAEPAMNAFLMDAVPGERRGRALGTVGGAQTAALAVGALVGGALFSAGLWVPFVASLVVSLALIVAGMPSLRAAGTGRPEVLPEAAVSHG